MCLTQPLPSGYFTEAEGFDEAKLRARRIIEALISMAHRVSSDQIYVFISPVLVSEIDSTLFSPNEVARQMETYNDMCELESKKYKNVTCLTIHRGRNKEHFYNLTHLNMNGHRHFAKTLFQHLSKEKTLD